MPNTLPACTILLALLIASCGPLSPRVVPPTLPLRTATIPAPATVTLTAAVPTGIPTRAAASTATRISEATPTPTHTPTSTSTPIVERGTLAPGFSLTVYAQVPGPASLAFGPDGRLYVASTSRQIYALSDLDGDQRAETVASWMLGLETPLGLLWINRDLYVSYRGAVSAFTLGVDGSAGSERPVVTNLPSFGLHQNNGLALGPDGYIYMGQGSTCDACREYDPRNGTILRFRPDGTELSVFASGMRNPYDVAFNAAGDLFATDNSRDHLGPSLPPEELNHIRAGQHYGWPECWAGGPVTAPCDARLGPVATFPAHTSADGLAFYFGEQFPADFYGNAFVAILGSIYMFPADTERGVMRVQLTPSGDTYTGVNDWFLELPDGRPVDLIVGPDGALYVADYANGEILRIFYSG